MDSSQLSLWKINSDVVVTRPSTQKKRIAISCQGPQVSTPLGLFLLPFSVSLSATWPLQLTSRSASGSLDFIPADFIALDCVRGHQRAKLNETRRH